MRNPTAIVVGVFAMLAISSPLHAQIVAPLLEKHAVEGGYAYKWFERDVSPPLDDADWEVASLFGRFGAFDWLTLTAEGGLWGIVDEKQPDEAWTRWTIGGGATAGIHRADHWNLVAQVSYNEVYDHDDTENRSDRRTRGWNVGVLAGTSFSWSGQRLDLWAGPMFVDDLIEIYQLGLDEPSFSVEPETEFAGAAGVYAVFFEHISGFAYVLYADNPQFRIGVSVRSRGDE